MNLYVETLLINFDDTVNLRYVQAINCAFISNKNILNMR